MGGGGALVRGAERGTRGCLEATGRTAAREVREGLMRFQPIQRVLARYRIWAALAEVNAARKTSPDSRLQCHDHPNT